MVSVTETEQSLEVETSRKFSRIAALGPGIMVAAAAIGGSHLVSSTQAGAKFGWQLAIIIILVNFFKYPFFQFGARYGAVANESVLAGYARLGKLYLILFLILNFIASIINIAALMALTTALVSWLFPDFSAQSFDLSHIFMTAVVLKGTAFIAIGLTVVSLLIILAGRYPLVDNVSKWIVALLAIFTIVAALLALSKPAVAPVEFVGESPWKLVHLGFIIALMGWMPAPVEISAMNSVWSRSKYRKQRPNLKAVLFDMNVGYIGTAVLALFFLALGVQLMYGSGIEPARSGAAFSKQLVELYAQTIGENSRYLIIIIAIFCAYSSMLTCMDGYNRVTKSAYTNLFGRDDYDTESPLLVLIVSLLALILFLQFPGNMMQMLTFAMISAFLTTPIISLLNFKLVTGKHIASEYKLSKLMFLWSYVGLVFLFGFAFLFIWQRWLS